MGEPSSLKSCDNRACLLNHYVKGRCVFSHSRDTEDCPAYASRAAASPVALPPFEKVWPKTDLSAAGWHKHPYPHDNPGTVYPLVKLGGKAVYDAIQSMQGGE